MSKNCQIRDIFSSVTGSVPTQQQVKLVSTKLPETVEFLALQWGWNDTEVRDFIYLWIKDNLENI